MRKLFKSIISVCIALIFFFNANAQSPTVTINQAAGQSDPTSASPINFTVTFSEAVTGFTGSDVSFFGSSGFIFSFPELTVTGGPIVYNVAVSGMTSNVTVVVTVPSGAAFNASNQSNVASTSTDNSVVYNIPPCSLTCPSNITVDATSASGAVVNYSVTPVGDCRSIARIPSPGITYPVGTTTVNAYNNVSTGLYYALTELDLISVYNFNTSGPTTSSSHLMITGKSGVITSIDFRSSNGKLYGLSLAASGIDSEGKLYTINTTTGLATQVGTGSFLIGGNVASIDFDPVTDILRLISNKGSNLRIDPDLGTVIGTDTWLAENFVAAAHTNSFSASTFTTLYSINSVTKSLYTQGGINGVPSSNTGLTTLVGPLGVNVSGVYGFDISLSATALAILLVDGAYGLYSINLNTGTATLIRNFVTAPYYGVGDIAIAPVTLPAPSCSFTVTVNPPPLTVTINKAATQADPTTTPPVKFTVVFDQDVTGFDASDISFEGSTVPGILVATVSGTGPTYQVSVSGITGAGNVVASVVAGAATNTSNQASLASTSTDNDVLVIALPHDLDIFKQSFPVSGVVAGGLINYIITVRYFEPGPLLQNVSVTDILPPGTRFQSFSFISSNYTPIFSLTTPPPSQNGTVNLLFPLFQPGQIFTFRIVVAVEQGLTGGISNTVTVGGPLGDINLSNNSSMAVTQIFVPPTIICPANVTVNTGATDCIGSVDLGGLNYVMTGNPAPTLSLSWRPLDDALAALNSIIVVPGVLTPRNFPKGVTTITATASNGVLPIATCQFTITVLDQTAPVITCPVAVSLNTDVGFCTATISNAVIGTATAEDNCTGAITITHSDFPAGNIFPIGATTVTWTVRDVAGNTSTCQQTITVKDDVAPVISGVSVNPAMLAPPNHKMKDVTIKYSVSDCSAVTNVLTVSDNEGSDPNDVQVLDDHHLKLRAERNGTGDGRIYTVFITSTDASGNSSTSTTTVVVAHNVTAPHSGAAFRVGSTVNFAGTFWDVAGNTHTSNWLIDDKTSVKGTLIEPSGIKNGKVAGSYKFTAPGVYKLQMNVTDQKGLTIYANTNGDLDAIVVIYDPNGGNTFGGGYYNSPAGALKSNPTATGKVSYGFAMNYFKNSTNPKGETQFEFKVGDFEFNALNFEYLVISNSMAQFKGTGKIIGGQSGIGFTMTVVDGDIDGTGVDKIRMKIYNRNTGEIIYDNQQGASDAALPIQPVGENSIVVISGTSSAPVTANRTENIVTESKSEEVSNGFDVIAFPNPSTNNFTIQLKGNINEKITMQVIDMYGRIIERRNVTANSMIRFGDSYRPGTYFVRIMQGKEHKEIKLIKLTY
ncbi:MAG: DUF4394 domain-containing protein [Chitinophagaceae bacterium]